MKYEIERCQLKINALSEAVVEMAWEKKKSFEP
jgi:hypothetical protein